MGRGPVRALLPLLFIVSLPALAHSTVVESPRQDLHHQLDELSRLVSDASREPRPFQRKKLLAQAQERIASLRSQAGSRPVGVSRPLLPAPPPPTARAHSIHYAIDDARLAALCETLHAEAFSRDRLRTLSEAAGSQYFLVSQVQRLLGHFEFSNDRLEAARLLRPRIVDAENQYKLYSAFEFSSDKERLTLILGG